MTEVVTPSDIKTITKGQAGKFVDVAVDALVKSGLSSELTQKILESQGAALAEEFVGAVRKRVEALQTLAFSGHKLVVARPYNPSDYYQDREGMLIPGGDFRKVVVMQAQQLVTEAEFEVEFYDLKRNAAYHSQVEAALPTEHLFNETNLCAVIAENIELQKESKEGLLLTNGDNIFYTRSHYVAVRWHSRRSLWLINVWPRGHGRLYDTSRVFSPRITPD